MFPLPAIPMLPKLHSFFEVEQTKTFMKFFGIALLVQWFLPWSGPGMSWNNFGATMWPLLVGLGFVVLTFVPGLADNLKPGILFLIAAGAGAVGVFWSFSGAGGPIFWGGGFGLVGLASITTGLFLWSRNGYQQLYWTLVLSGLIGMALALLIPFGGTLPLVAIFTQVGGGIWGILGGIIGIVVSLAFIGLIVLMVMNVFLKKEDADPVQVERFGSALFVAAFLFPFVQGVFGLSGLATFLHMIVTSAIFLWLAIWGMVCLFEAKARGENLLAV